MMFKNPLKVILKSVLVSDTKEQIQYKKIGDEYVCTKDFVYYSKRYDKYIIVEEGFTSDGATGAKDIGFIPSDRHRRTAAWFVHDKACATGTWSDGSKINNWQASTLLYDILLSDRYYVRSWLWWAATYLLGGGKARDNGMKPIKNNNI